MSELMPDDLAGKLEKIADSTESALRVMGKQQMTRSSDFQSWKDVDDLREAARRLRNEPSK